MDWSSVYSYDNDEKNVKKTMMDRQCDADLTLMNFPLVFYLISELTASRQL